MINGLQAELFLYNHLGTKGTAGSEGTGEVEIPHGRASGETTSH